MKHLLSFIIVCFAFSISAQITIAPTPLALVGTADQDEIEYDLYITNTKDTTYTIYWQVIKDNTFPAQWETYLYDLNLSYGANIDKCSNNLPNSLNKSTFKFQLYLQPNGLAANATVTFKLFTGKNMQGEILSVPITLSTSPSSTKEINPSQINFFPNPTTDYFKVENGQNVDKIVIYDLIGKEVKSLFHYNNAIHDINELKSGMYILKMFDSKGRVIKSIKLSKAFAGA